MLHLNLLYAVHISYVRDLFLNFFKIFVTRKMDFVQLPGHHLFLITGVLVIALQHSASAHALSPKSCSCAALQHLLGAHLCSLFSRTRPALHHSAKTVKFPCSTQKNVVTFCIKAMVIPLEGKQCKFSVATWLLEKWLLKQQIKPSKTKALCKKEKIINFITILTIVSVTCILNFIPFNFLINPISNWGVFW